MQSHVCLSSSVTCASSNFQLPFVQSENCVSFVRNLFARFPGCIRAETPGYVPQFPPLTHVRFRSLKKPLIYKSSRSKQRTSLNVRAREGGGGGRKEGACGCRSNQTSTD